MTENDSTDLVYESVVEKQNPPIRTRRKFLEQSAAMLGTSLLPKERPVERRVADARDQPKASEFWGKFGKWLRSKTLESTKQEQNFTNNEIRERLIKNGPANLDQERQAIEELWLRQDIAYNPVSIKATNNEDMRGPNEKLLQQLERLGVKDDGLNLHTGTIEKLVASREINVSKLQELFKFVPSLWHSPTALYMVKDSTDLETNYGNINAYSSKDKKLDGLNGVGFDRIIILREGLLNTKDMATEQFNLASFAIKTLITGGEQNGENRLNPYFKNLVEMAGLKFPESAAVDIILGAQRYYCEGKSVFLNVLKKNQNIDSIENSEIFYEFIKTFIYGGVEFEKDKSDQINKVIPDIQYSRDFIGKGTPEHLKYLDFFAKNGTYPSIDENSPLVQLFKENIQDANERKKIIESIQSKYGFYINSQEAIQLYGYEEVFIENNLTIEQLQTVEEYFAKLSKTKMFEVGKKYALFIGKVRENKSGGFASNQNLADYDGYIYLDGPTFQSSFSDNDSAFRYIFNNTLTHEYIHVRTCNENGLRKEYSEDVLRPYKPGEVYDGRIMKIDSVQLKNLFKYNPSVDYWTYGGSNWFEFWAVVGTAYTYGKNQFKNHVEKYLNGWNEGISDEVYNWLKKNLFFDEEFEDFDFDNNKAGEIGLNIKSR